MLEKKWISNKINEEAVSKLSEEASVSKLMARVFLNRGTGDAISVKKFLNPSLSELHDPFLLEDMDKAVERISRALDENEKITIYGDYDVDGITSTSVLYNFLSYLGADIEYFIPDRNVEGYGLSINSLEKIINNGTKLIISVDCGVTAIEEVDFVNLKGAEIIITDHHRCIETLPLAVAVVNANRPDSKYPFKHLAGVGIVYKIITAICITRKLGEIYNDYLDLVALGTVADVVPLLDENRIIVKNGIDLIRRTKNTGLKTMISQCNIKSSTLSAYNIAYIIAPRINAAGRIGDAGRAVRLFSTTVENEAVDIVTALDKENRFRQETELEILNDVLEILKSDSSYENKNVLVVVKEGWHQGVIGIVASRIKEKFFKPCILISIENGVGKGSGRSIDGFNLFDALSNSSDLLKNFGGHELAAGLSIEKINIAEFEREINKYAENCIDIDAFRPKMNFDCEINANEINIESVHELEKLSPFGAGNPHPLFSLNRLTINDIRNVGDDCHLKILFNRENLLVDSIGFNLGEYKKQFSKNEVVDALFGIEINLWNNIEKLQLNLKDIHFNAETMSEKLYSLSLNQCMNEYLTHRMSYNQEGNAEFKTESATLDEYLKKITKSSKSAIFTNSRETFSLLKSEIENFDIKKKVKICYNICDKADEGFLHIVINPLYQKIETATFDSIGIFGNLIDKNYINRIFSENRIEDFYFIDNFGSESSGTKEIAVERNELISVYQYIKSKSETSLLIEDIFEFSNKISCSYKNKMNVFKFMISIKIFNELKLLEFIESGELGIKIDMISNNGSKANLESSKILKTLREINKGFCT